jgi:hypothetical protein
MRERSKQNMRTAKAKSPPEATPKPKPGSVESIRRQTAEPETATALLKGAPVAPKSAPKPAYAKVDDGAAAITEMCRLMLQVGRDNPTAEAIAKATAAPAAPPKPDRRTDPNVFSALMDLERPIRELFHLAQIVSEWAAYGNFYHPDPAQDADTNRARADQTDRLVFGIDEIADRAAGLDKAFHSAFSAPKPIT